MPLFWFRMASSGSGPERYTLQVPFQFGPTHSLTTTDTRHVAFRNLALEIVENQDVQLLRVTGFKAASEAEEIFPRLRGALLHLIVRKQLSLRTARGMQVVQLKDPPVDVRGNPNFGGLLESKGWTHVDGYVDPSPTVIIPEHLRIMEFGVGSLSVKLSMPVPSFLEQLAEGLTLPRPDQIAADERLSLSIDLYAASLWETSQKARVVGLATALEALIEPEPVNQAALEKLDELLEVFDSSRDRPAEDEERRRALDRMRSRLAELKEESISEKLRKLAATHSSALGETVEDARRNMVLAYRVRSTLLHEGHVTDSDIASAAAWLNKSVPAILESLATTASTPRDL